MEAGETKKLMEKFESNLVSLIEFGLETKNKKQRKHLLVLKEIDMPDLQKLKQTSFVDQNKYFVITLKEFKESQDVFPLFFLDLLEKPKVLLGEDLTKKIKIERKLVRHELERSLRSSLISFRNYFLETGFLNKKQLFDSFSNEVEPILVSLLYMKNEKAFSIQQALEKVEALYKIENKLSNVAYNNATLDEKLETLHEFLEELTGKVN